MAGSSATRSIPVNTSVWFLLGGALLAFMAIGSSLLKLLPITTAILYLGAGVALGPAGAGLLTISLPAESRLLEHVTEVAAAISLFTVGLKLRVPLTDSRWRRPREIHTRRPTSPHRKSRSPTDHGRLSRRRRLDPGAWGIRHTVDAPVRAPELARQDARRGADSPGGAGLVKTGARGPRAPPPGSPSPACGAYGLQGCRRRSRRRRAGTSGGMRASCNRLTSFEAPE